ncbi:hypothetical protein RFI_07856 [Reticulomyxa filosa]|uniref:Tubulin alpha chain n=1 Tax=Reticulomyxa filosa TaxID=46433 RepID=X6NVF8_RETFI|nr:hypothetical protein RFI_07856 [Reticulomyxa filosa]|eukprot:ETO29267.1 hypothetical protein RFI_07856 [Reticulomyxa filosa]
MIIFFKKKFKKNTTKKRSFFLYCIKSKSLKRQILFLGYLIGKLIQNIKGYLKWIVTTLNKSYRYLFRWKYNCISNIFNFIVKKFCIIHFRNSYKLTLYVIDISNILFLVSKINSSKLFQYSSKKYFKLIIFCFFLQFQFTEKGQKHFEIMHEIITVEVGQAGIQVGNSVWEQYCAEHNISTTGKQQRVIKDSSFKVFFEEKKPNVIDEMKSGLFDSNFLLSGNEDATTFARAYYTSGKQILDKVNDQLRKLADNCDNIMGFMMTNSIAGGTGSGLGALILERLAVDYRKKIKVDCVIYPSHTLSTSVIEPYNAMLAMRWLLGYTEVILAFDNESIYNICQSNLHIAKPDISNVNRLITKVISSMTASMRFSGELNTNLNELQTNLVPFPRLHFMTTSMSPIVSKTDVITTPSDVQTITNECFKHTNWFIYYDSFDPVEDKYMSIVLNYRGNVTSKEANIAIQSQKTNNQVFLVEWCPTGFKIGLNDIPAAVLEQDDIGACSKNAVMIANNTGISRTFNKLITQKYDLMYSQRAFLHWYVGEGIDSDLFFEAREEMEFLERDYLDILSESLDEVDDYVNDDNY